MSRRALSLMLLAILAVQMLGGVALESVCVESCPDDAEEASCPPVCTLCTNCRHAQSAIVGDAASGTPLVVTERFLTEPATAPPSRLTADIFHVPLAG